MLNPVGLEIPSIRDGQIDFNNLFKIYHQVEQAFASKSVIQPKFLYDFSRCRTIYPNAIAFLYGLFRHVKSKDRDIFYVEGSIRKDIQSKLAQTGFLKKIEEIEDYQEKETLVPLREDKKNLPGTEDSIINYLKNEWLQKDWIHLSDLVRNAITGQVWEMYDNAFSHSNSPIGIFSCGQKIENKFKLSLVDFGRNIPFNVREFLNDKKMSSSKALRWAFKDGNTTKKDNRGLGLGLLKSFVKLNKGELEIFSGTGHVKINEKEDMFSSKKTCFNGTLIYITLMCDDKYYHFSNEMPPANAQPLF